MTLMVLGGVVFNVLFNPQETSEERDVPFAKHEVVGSAPIYEFMGEGQHSFTINGVLYPRALGGYGDLLLLESAQQQHVPLPLIRGDGRPLGWALIQNLKRNDNTLDETGIGGEITFSVSLLMVGAPSVDGASAILRLFL